MEFILKKVLLALLFSTSEHLSVRDVQTVISRYHQRAEEDLAELEKEIRSESDPVPARERQAVMKELIAQVPSLLTAAQIREAMETIAQELLEKEQPLRLMEGPQGWRLVVAAEMADWVRLLREQPKPQRLSPSALETLAVIAYRQPVTRAELEAVRGVSSDSALNTLLEKELIQIVGRADLPGRPIQYGTTVKFLEWCGLRSIEELPASDVLSPNALTEFIRRATQPTMILSDADVGLPEDAPVQPEQSP